MNDASNPELARAVLMVAPEHFAFNPETAEDNPYMSSQRAEVERALAEFDTARSALDAMGVEVVEVRGHAEPLPDAVFPNNWISTDSDGLITVFPMKHPSRRRETEQLPAAIRALAHAGFRIDGVLRLDQHTSSAALEGTGSLVLDRVSSAVYAALSPRTDAALVSTYARLRGYRDVELFEALGRASELVYHTNVVMGLGRGFAVICSDAIEDRSQRGRVLERLHRTREVIEVDRRAMNESFCCNLIGVESRRSTQAIVLSRTALDGFTPSARKRLERFGDFCVLDIPTIERVGGGSARCMVAEIFLPKADDGRSR
ncbi:MAG: hypothetical protein HY791_19960 [Deltaproteobacteria bacterium]|nr:hypothetical protein [Deltaproteobacteria bacterium]